MEMVEEAINNSKGVVANKSEEEQLMDLPPGFRFHPTDEEIITHYLMEKVMNINFSASAIGEVDMNKCEPWDLPKKAKMGEKEWYFFCQKDRKYPTGMRTNRATESGYWKATGKDKEIYKGKKTLVGMKKTLVFYKGRAPKGEKSNWVMHEYRLEGNFSYYRVAKQDEWVVSRVFHKSSGIKKVQFHDMMFNASNYLPPLMDPPYTDGSTSNHHQHYQNKKIENNDDNNNNNNYNNNRHMMTINTSNIEGVQNLYHHVPLSNLNPLLSNSTYGSLPSNYSSVSGFGDHAILRALAGKVEQFSSSYNHNSMVSPSQETGGVSNDMNTEISSVLKQDMGIAELDCFWDY